MFILFTLIFDFKNMLNVGENCCSLISHCSRATIFATKPCHRRVHAVPGTARVPTPLVESFPGVLTVALIAPSTNIGELALSLSSVSLYSLIA